MERRDVEKAIELKLLLVNLDHGAHADHSNAWPTHRIPLLGGLS